MNKRLKKSLVILTFLSAFMVKSSVSAYEFMDLNTDIIMSSDIYASQQLGSFSNFQSVTGLLDGGVFGNYSLYGNDNRGIEINLAAKGYDVNYTIANIGSFADDLTGDLTVKIVEEMTGDIYERNIYAQGGISGFKNTYQTTSETNGGAIFVSEKDATGSLTINNSVISDNHLDLQDKGAHGGAVYAGFMTLKTDNVIFKGNSIKSLSNKIFKGGAVHQDIGVGTADFKNTINNTYFIDNKIETPNSSAADGGALNMEKGSVEINSSYFGNNQIQAAKGKGGAVALQSGNVKQADIRNTVFEKNSINVTDSTTSPSASGAALYYYGFSSNGKINIDNSAFMQNSITATGATSGNIDGGAVDVGSAKEAVINKTKFTNNSISNQIGSKAQGGALYTSANSTIVNESNFDSNTSTLHQVETEATKSGEASGGAIYLMNTSSTNGKTLTVSDSTFTNNKTISTSTSKGGAIFAGGVLKVSNSTFKNNQANSTCENNYDAYGGAIYTDTYATYSIVDNSNFENNSTTSNVIKKSVNSGGGAFYNSKVALIKDSSFRNNTAFGTQNKYNSETKGAFGGAILNKINGILSIMADKKDVVFEGNRYGTASSGFKNNAIYTDKTSTVNLNAAQGKKIVFNDNIESANNTATLNINQTGTWDETTAPTTSDNKISNKAGTTGEIVVNSDMSGFLGTVNLFGGKITLGQNGTLFDKAKAFIVKAQSNATVSLADNVIKEYDFGNLTLEDNLNVIIDADLSSSNPQSDKLSATTIVNDSDYRILISKINIIKEDKLRKVVTVVADDVLREIVELSTNPDVVIEGAVDSYILTYDNTNGELTFKSATASDNLNSVVEQTQSDRLYSLAQNENVQEDLGKLGGANSTMTINGADNSIVADNSTGSKIAGVEIDNSQTLNVNEVKEVSGFSSQKGGFATNEGTMNVVDSSFKSNESATQGGAIQNKGTLNITADKKDVVFEGNNDSTNTNNAIYSEGGEINLIAKNSDIIFNDSVSSNESAIMNINKPETTKQTRDVDVKGDIIVNSDMSNFKGIVNLFGGKLSLLKDSTFFSAAKSFNVKQNSNATVSFADTVIKQYDLGNLNLEDDLRIIIDADLAAQKADNFDAQSVVDNGNKIIISEINITKDMTSDSVTAIIASDKLKDLFELSTNPNVNLIGTTNSYYLTYKKDSGELEFSIGEDLNKAFIKTDDNRIYALSKDEMINTPLGQMGGSSTTMTISGNNHSIISNNTEGMSIGQNQTLNINNVKEITGFNDSANAIIKNEGTLNLVDTSIKNNTIAQSQGAINNSGVLNITADKTNVALEGNRIGNPGADQDKTNNIAIVNSNEINLAALNSNIKLNDAIIGVGNNSKININNGNGVVEFNNLVNNSTITQHAGTIKLLNGAEFAQDVNYIYNQGVVSLQNNEINSANLGNVTLNNDMNLKLDANFATKEIDTIAVNDITTNDNTINITDIIVLDPTTEESFSLSPVGEIADEQVKTKLGNAIRYTGGQVVYSPIFKYNAQYDPDSAMLNFSLLKGINPQKPKYEALNPGILAAPVAAQLGGYLVQLNSYYQAFMNMDMYMLLPQKERTALKYRNKLVYAQIANAQGNEIIDTPYNTTSDATLSQYENRTGFFRPYATFESVGLKNGPKVDNTLYGSYFGTDSEIKQLKNGWDRVWSAYIGYNGSHQSYDNVSIYQNGGTLGLSSMFYKNNFFQGLSANVGANAASADSFFGKDNFTMLLTGVASKTGYNFEFKEGKYIIQPSFLAAYSFVNSFDYTNGSNVRITSDALNAITLEPEIKFIANLRNAWQPYGSVSMVFNILDKTKFNANDVSLPDLSVKPYVRYGLGIRKLWGNSITGFFQTYITNGGRNGVGLQAGVNVILGKLGLKH